MQSPWTGPGLSKHTTIELRCCYFYYIREGLIFKRLLRLEGGKTYHISGVSSKLYHLKVWHSSSMEEVGSKYSSTEHQG
jgi:hypothetical protein